MKNLRYIFAVTFFLASLVGYSQKLIVKRANQEYDLLRFASAAELYEEAILDGAASQEVYLKLADSYYKIKDTRNAEKYYQKASEGTLTDADKFQYWQSMLQNGKTDEAIVAAKSSTGSKRITNIGTTDSKKILSDSTVNAVYFMDFNTPYSDFSPTAYDKGLVFVSSRHRGSLHKNVFGWNNTPFLNLYYVDTTGLKKAHYYHAIKREQFQKLDQPQLYAYDNKLHTDETRITANDTRTAGYYGIYFRKNATDTLYFKREVSPFNEFNTKFHEGPVAFNKTKDVIIFTRNNYQHGKFKKDAQGVNRLKMFMAKKSGEGWSTPTEVPFNSDAFSVGHPAFDANDQYVYFSSDMPGGSGGSDLYRVPYNEGKFGKPENLGDKINTDGNELFPFVSNDILYLTSDGHGGLGGLDMMAVSLKNFSQQKNLGYPINTNKDDFGLSISESGKEGFVSSNRNRIGLDDDIYYFTRTKPVSFTNPIRVLVIDRATQKPISGANVVPTNSLAPCTTDKEGFCVFDAEPNNTYSFVGKKEKYLDGSSSIDLKEDQLDALVRVYLDEFGNSLYCLVKERGTSLPLADVKVTVTDKNTGEKFMEESTSGFGELRRRLTNTKVGDQLNYDFRFEHPGYLTKTAVFNYTIQKPGEIPVHELMDINLDKIDLGMDIGKLIKINPIYFDLNKDVIRKDAAVELEKIVQVMRDNPTMVIELGSHTDCRSTAAYNMALSDRRAKSSAQYVVSKGIDKSRIYGKGYGETKLVNGCACEGAVKPNCSEAEHQLNRRTEFIIVKM